MARSIGIGARYQPRRQFLESMTGLALGVASLPLLDGCAPSVRARVPRIGYLSLGVADAPETQRLAESFREGLREHGYVEGETIAIEYRFAGSLQERLPQLAAELIERQVAVIVTGDSQSVTAAREATRTIPIVMTISGDVVRLGLVESLARPGGNITGMTDLSTDLSGKRLEWLLKAVPTVSRVAVLWNAALEFMDLQWHETQAAAEVIGIPVQSVPVQSVSDIRGAVEAATDDGADGLLVLPDPLTASFRAPLVTIVADRRLPAMYGTRLMAEVGGLMSYGADRYALPRRAAAHVDKILKGTNPADLPIERPARFELVINMKTAQALGVAIPTSVLSLANAVIQ